MKDEAVGRVEKSGEISRRFFLGSAAGASALALAPMPAQSKLVKSVPSAGVGSIEAVKGLVARNFPGREGDFEFTLVPRGECGHDRYEVSSSGGKIAISGSSALALASGLHWYIKYMVRRHWSWCGKNWELPASLPAIINPVKNESPYLHNGYFNYCTFNYTMSWWGWERWEKEIDYMALNNVTFPLAITGVENVWLNFLMRLGYTRDEAKKYICGPAYFAWWLMGNLEGYGGPLPDSWLESHLELGQKIVARQREFGMEPMLQGFVGLVPTTLKAKKPGAHILPQGLWCNYERPDVLDPTDPLFPELAKIWYEELEKLFGKTRYFAGDLFHEGGKTGGVALADAGAAVYREMEKASPGAVWVLQGWGGNPKPGMMRGLKPGQALILDLFADQNAAWKTRNSWGGHPWCWNTIVNFGGNPGVFGRMPIEARDPVVLLDHRWLAKNLVGLGTTPEAIDNNPVVWDLHFEMFWRNQSPDLKQWVKDYAFRRYGAINADAEAAWQTLLNTAYNAGHKGLQTSMINYRPPATMAVLKNPPAWASSSATYDHAKFLPAVKAMHAAAKKLAGRDAFDYDLIDVTRQFLSNLMFKFADRLQAAFLKKDVAGYKTWAGRIRELLLDLDALLATRRDFMMGAWIADARAWGKTDAEKDLYEWNARNLVTCWTYDKDQLNDYSRREWSGLIKDYYLPRWQAFIDYHAAVLEGRQAKAPDYYRDIEKGYADKRDAYPSEPVGPTAPKAKEMYEKYWALMEAEGLYRL